jgi:hypothetical protein
LHVITKGGNDTWNMFPALAIHWNIGTGHANLSLCKSQQGYSPPGEGTALVRFWFFG